MAGVAALVALKLLSAYRDLAALRDACPDVWASAEAEILVAAPFPARPSRVMAF